MSKNEIICFDVWLDKEKNNYYADVFSFNRKTRKSTDIETTESMSTIGKVKCYVHTRYPGAICIHCG